MFGGDLVPRKRTIKVSEEEYQRLKDAQRELEVRNRAELAKAPGGSQQASLDLGTLALGAIAGLGALALLEWLTKSEEEDDE